MFLSATYYTSPTDGGNYMMKAYLAVTIGGWGSIPGTVAGAFLVALFEVLIPAISGADPRPRCVSAHGAVLHDVVHHRSVRHLPRRAAAAPRGPVRRSHQEEGVSTCPPSRSHRGRHPGRPRAYRLAAMVFSSPFDLRIFTLTGVFALMVIGYQFIFGQRGGARALSGNLLRARCLCHRHLRGEARLQLPDDGDALGVWCPWWWRCSSPFRCCASVPITLRSQRWGSARS